MRSGRLPVKRTGVPLLPALLLLITAFPAAPPIADTPRAGTPRAGASPGAAIEALPAGPGVDQLSRTPGYFISLDTPHFTLISPERNRGALEWLAGEAEKIHDEIARPLEVGLSGRVRVFILSRQQDFDQLAFPLPPAPEWSEGFALARQRIIVLKTAHLQGRLRADVMSTFRHELVHLLVADAAGRYAALVPRWFNEGLAMVHTRAWGLREVINLSRQLIRRPHLPLAEITHRFPEQKSAAQLAYAESFLFISHLNKTFGPAAPGKILRFVGAGEDFPAAFEQATGERLDAVEARWLTSLKWRYRYIPIATSSFTVWIALSLLVLFGYLRKRKRGRETLARWEEEEGPGW